MSCPLITPVLNLAMQKPLPKNLVGTSVQLARNIIISIYLEKTQGQVAYLYDREGHLAPEMDGL